VVVAISYLLDPAAWATWVDLLRNGTTSAAGGDFATVGWYLPVALVPRLVVAAVVIGVGAARNARWLLPVAVVLAMPVVWLNSLAVLAACVPLAVPSLLAADRWQAWTWRRGTQAARASGRETVAAGPTE
jgi:hypothetical protein